MPRVPRNFDLTCHFSDLRRVGKQYLPSLSAACDCTVTFFKKEDRYGPVNVKGDSASIGQCNPASASEDQRLTQLHELQVTLQRSVEESLVTSILSHL